MTPAEPIAEPQAESETEDFGPNNENLPENLIECLRKITIAVQDVDGYGKYLRRIEVMREWRNRLYEQGTQHIYWQGGPEGGGFALVSPGGLVTTPNGQKVQAPRFVDDYDICGPYSSILTAVQTQDDPDVSFRAKNPNNPDDVDGASEAECYRDIYDDQNDVSATDVEIYRKLLLSSRVVAWTRTEEDGERLGFENDDPEQPRSFEKTTIFSTVDARVPILAKTQSECHYATTVVDLDINVLRSKFPDVADELTPGCDAIGESKYERLARLGVLQNAGRIRGNVFPDLSAFSNVWLRPSNWNRKDVSDEERAELQRLFPMGAHCAFVGETYVGSWAESMDDALTIVGGIRPSSGMFQRALIDPIITIQDSLNDAENTSRLIWEVGWPSTWWATEQTEYDAANDQTADPYSIRLLKDLGPGRDATSVFYREPDPAEPETFVTHKNSLRADWPQFQLAAQPSLFGGAEAAEAGKTASGYAQANKNALGTQGLAFRVKEGIWAQIYLKAAMCARKRDMAQPMSSADGRVLDPNKFGKGNFGAYPDRDSGFPESTQAKRQILQNLVTMAGTSPMLQQMLDNPQNVETFLELNGFPELVIPEAEAGKKQMREIAQLLKATPIPPTPEAIEQSKVQHAALALQAQEAGQPEPPFTPLGPTSTIQPDPMDFHYWEFTFGQAWLSSDDCWRQINNGNEKGVENVRLHLAAHWQMKGQVQWPTGSPPPMPPPPGFGKPPGQPGVGVPAAPSAPAALA